jgi:AraC family transcriptional regulator
MDADSLDNYLLKIIKDTTEYIEDNILESLNLDCISDNVNISKFHLLRMWKGATSTGLMEYVRRRRLALSLTDLLNRKNSIEYISSKYSFGCERTYNRSFKDEYGITPAKWRKSPCPLSILDRFNADFMNCAGNGLMFFKSIVILPSFTIAGPEYFVGINDNIKNMTANKLAVDFFYNLRPKVINPVEKDVYIGFTKLSGSPDGYTLYQPAVKIDQNSIIPSGMKARRINAHKYGVFTYMGPHRPEDISSGTLSHIWQYVFEKWMPTVRFELDETFHFELVNYAKCNKHYCECDLYYPISKL